MVLLNRRVNTGRSPGATGIADGPRAYRQDHEGNMCRGALVSVVYSIFLAAVLSACLNGTANGPSTPAGPAIEPGTPVSLDSRQLEAVVKGVAAKLDTLHSLQFGAMYAARNSRGIVAACGTVYRRDPQGMAGLANSYVGVLTGSSAHPEFVVVGVGASPQDRREVDSLCHESGATGSGALPR
jgi:hypothetical protein